MTALPRIEIDPLAPPPPRIIEDNSQRRSTGTPRPKGVHTKHLTELERFRVRTLYYDAYMSKARIREITGYSVNQIRTAVRAGSASVGKRPGRPKGEKKGGRSTNAELPTRSSSDANTELIQQARKYFAEQAKKTPGNDGDSNDNDNDRASEDGEEDDEHDESTALNAQTRTTTASPAQTDAPRAVPVLTGLPTLATVTATTTSIPPSPPPPARTGKTFADLPPSLRLYIWRCVLSTAPTQTAPSRTWALAVLPKSPWLELGLVAPPHVGRLENPPWSHYVQLRHVPATVLARVNREARGVVLERCSPILISGSVREAAAAGRESGVPRFVWVDRVSDALHFYGEEFRGELFGRAGRSACPEFYR